VCSRRWPRPRRFAGVGGALLLRPAPAARIAWPVGTTLRIALELESTERARLPVGEGGADAEIPSRLRLEGTW